MKHHRKTTIWSAFGAFALASIPQLAPAATLTINGCDTLTVEANGTITCKAVAATPPVEGAPTGCTVSPPSVALPVTGGQVNAPTVACTGGGQVAQTTWTRLQAAVSFPVALPANALGSPQTYTYAGSVCTATNLCTPVSYSATVAAGETVPPVAGSCGNLKVIPAVRGKRRLQHDDDFHRSTLPDLGTRGPGYHRGRQDHGPGRHFRADDALVAPYGGCDDPQAWLSQDHVRHLGEPEAPYVQAGAGPTMKIQVGGDPGPRLTSTCSRGKPGT
ncbi:MAG: hypothetical protein IPJ62_05260 [Betaproteobacteria bacterium]|nr:hypothetical protein [Betaproteobacteria bacterium]